MNENGYSDTALFEHRFWLQVLGDHARFILDSLSPREEVEVKRAKEYMRIFDGLLATAHQPLRDTDIEQLNREAERYAKEMRGFKLHLLRLHLTSQLKCGLSPSFLNHMVSEIEEYIRILKYLNQGEIPPLQNPLHHHLLWLTDAAGHASILASDLDFVEKTLKAKSEAFAKTFEAFQLKAIELAGYLRTNLDQFPALTRFNQEAGLEVQLFRSFLIELEEMEMDLEVLGTLTPLMPDHMAREECYYLQKLMQVSEYEAPLCDPTTTRPAGTD